MHEYKNAVLWATWVFTVYGDAVSEYMLFIHVYMLNKGQTN